MRRIPLQLTIQPERLYGEPTGSIQYRAEAIRPTSDNSDYTFEDWNLVNGVLGRTTDGADAAVRDWNLRASADGHRVIGHLHNAKHKPTNTMNAIQEALSSNSSAEAFDLLLALSDERQQKSLKLIASIHGKASAVDFVRQMNEIGQGN
tara:strand:+ start:3845 stop:4291 length:447 start_codon:yes stop_codon:yes gene_type:complete